MTPFRAQSLDGTRELGFHGEMFVFGDRCLAQRLGCAYLASPPSMVCFRCNEWIAPIDAGVVQHLVGTEGPASIAYHYECHARSIIGSLGHLQKRCSCYGGTEEDPPEMTQREAAKAALAFFRECITRA